MITNITKTLQQIIPVSKPFILKCKVDICISELEYNLYFHKDAEMKCNSKTIRRHTAPRWQKRTKSSVEMLKNLFVVIFIYEINYVECELISSF